MEHYLHAVGIPHMILRLANVYGPRQKNGGEGGVVANFVHDAVSGDSLYIHGDGTQTRDFVFVKDVAEAIERALFVSGNGIINVSSGVETSILELSNLVLRVSQSKSRIVYRESRVGDIQRSVLCPEQCFEKLCWKPNIKLEQGIVEYLREVNE